MTTTTFTLTGAGTSVVLSVGNLKVNITNPFVYSGARATLARSTGKWWFEVDTSGMGSLATDSGIGVVNTGSPNYALAASVSFGAATIYRSGQVWVGGSSAGSAQNIQASGHVMCAVDLDTNRIWFNTIGVSPMGWNGSLTNDPDAGIGGFDISAITASLPGVYPFCVITSTANSFLFNFGASAPIITPPATFCPWNDDNCTPTVPTVHLIQGPNYRLPPFRQVFTLTSNSPANCRLVCTERRDGFSSGEEVVAPADAATMDVTETRDTFAGEVVSVTLPHGLIEGEIIYVPQEDQGVRIEPEPFNEPFTIPYENTVVIIPYEDR